MGHVSRITYYVLRRGVRFLLPASCFLLLILFAVTPAFAVDPIVPPDCYEQGDYSLGSFLDIAQNIMKFVWSISGAFALLMFFFGGILWLVSAGEDKRVTQGRDTMIQAATGLIIVLGSWVFVNFVVAALHGETDWTKTATVFDKEWSSYNTGYGGSPCLGQYWKDKFPILSSHAPACSGAPLPNISPYATCDLACKAGSHVSGSMVGGVCCCIGTATASPTTPPAAAPAPAAPVPDPNENGTCCIFFKKQNGESACDASNNPLVGTFFTFNPPRPDNDEVLSPTKTRGGCPEEGLKEMGVAPVAGKSCHIGLRVEAPLTYTNLIDSQKVQQIRQTFCGQKSCSTNPNSPCQ